MENEIKMPAKPKPSMSIDHSDMPDAAGMQLGDDVHLHIHGKVKGIHSGYGPEDSGHTEIEIHKVDHDGAKKSDKKKKKNAAHMPVDELKEVIKSQEKSEEGKESM